ncbi:MAG: hypothetical protein Q9214_002471 [Letrouitia sp. 1 TL-2023]
MQAQWVYGSGHIVDLRAPSLNSENVESSVLGSLESSELERLSNLESAEENIESHLEGGAGNQEANNDASSVVSSLHTREHHDESDEDRNSSYIFDERYDEDNNLDETIHPDNVQPADSDLVIDPKIYSFPPPKVHVVSREQAYAEILGITISDDRSADSKIEERNLLALRGRETKTTEREASPPTPILAYPPTAREGRELRERRDREQERQLGISIGQQELEQISSNNSAAMDANAVGSDINQVLDPADPSKVDLQKLQDYIGILQAQAGGFKSIESSLPPFRYKIIYRIQRLELAQQELVQQQNGKQYGKKWEECYVPFFDHPEWVRGHGTASDIKSNLPLTNFELYLERNKDISFIVYRNFDLKSARSTTASGTDSESDGIAHRPHHTNETVRLVNKDLIEAIKALLDSQQQYAELAHEFSVSLELPAPYLFIYHNRKNLEKFQDSLSVYAKAQVSLLLNYVTEQYADEYAAADSLLSRNKISPKLLRYLFKPGDLLISRVEGQYKGYVSTSWPKISGSKKVSRMGAATSHKGAEISLYGTQDADARMANDKIIVYFCRVDVWDWGFDENFQRQHSTLSLDIPANEDRE